MNRIRGELIDARQAVLPSAECSPNLRTIDNPIGPARPPIAHMLAWAKTKGQTRAPQRRELPNALDFALVFAAYDLKMMLSPTDVRAL